MSVLVGHSGVGKSTLVNALVPDAARAVSHVNPVTGRGRHTSSSALALELPDGGWIIDTPGVRSFGLAHVDPRNLVGAFPDLAEGSAECPRGCGHLQPDCALDTWVAAGHADEARLRSLRRLLESREAESD
jgi:ribosome biogenesis GTPase